MREVCPICKGRKVNIGNGYIKHPCTFCDGKGWIDRGEEPTIKNETLEKVVNRPEDSLEAILEEI